MRRPLGLFLIFTSMFILAACSGSGSSDISGPVLDVGSVDSIALDQFFINGGVQDEFLGQGKFSVYLRDASSGKDLACTAAVDGMKKLSSAESSL